jgi:hypothetical protein
MRHHWSLSLFFLIFRVVTVAWPHFLTSAVCALWALYLSLHPGCGWLFVAMFGWGVFLATGITAFFVRREMTRG